jgi:Tol biopolymer transport system component
MAQGCYFSVIDVIISLSPRWVEKFFMIQHLATKKNRTNRQHTISWTLSTKLTKTAILQFFLHACLSLFCGIFLSSCGGKNQTTDTSSQNLMAGASDASRTASISLKIRWPEKPIEPEPTRLIPLAAQSIKIELRDVQNNLIGGTPKIIARPATGNTSNALFSALPIGSIAVKATAFPNADATGVAQSTGTIAATITIGQTTPATIAMDSTIASVKINGNDGTALTVGQTRTLTAQALNSAGETVLVAPSQWEWTSSDTINFTLTPSGESANLKANIAGSTTITLKDKESGKTFPIVISSDDGSLNNTKIVFSSNTDGFYQIYTINPDGTGLKKITNGDGNNYHAFFSPDSEKIVFSSTRDNPSSNFAFEIYTMNSDGTNALRLTNNTDIDYLPSFSPDGKKIAFTSEYTTFTRQQIHIMNTDGTNKMSLTDTKANNYRPRFSPDGNKIVFYDGSVWIMNVDGTGLTNLTGNTTTYTNPSFSPDGTKIVCDSGSVVFQGIANGIFIMNTDGSGMQRITNNAFLDYLPSFSPDGRKIVFVSRRDGSDKIYTMNVDGTNQRRLTDSTATESTPSWSSGPVP